MLSLVTYRKFEDDDGEEDEREAALGIRFGLTNAVRFEQGQGIKLVRILGKTLLLSVLTLGATTAMGESSYQGQPLTQVKFTHLVPITYPLKTTRFTALTPRSYPVIQPGVARVHIIRNLVRPLGQPLLRIF